MSETAAVAQSTTPPSKKRKISLAGTESSSPSQPSVLTSSKILSKPCTNGNTRIVESSVYGKVKEDSMGNTNKNCVYRKVKVCKIAPFHPWGVCTKTTGLIHVPTVKETLTLCIIRATSLWTQQ